MPPTRCEIPLNEVFRRRCTVAHGGHAELAAAYSGDPRLPHEPRDPLDVDAPAIDLCELSLDPRRSVGAVGHRVDRLDAGDERGIVGRSPRGRTAAPRI